MSTSAIRAAIVSNYDLIAQGGSVKSDGQEFAIERQGSSRSHGGLRAAASDSLLLGPAAGDSDKDKETDSPIVKALKDQIKSLQAQLETQMKQLQKAQNKASKDVSGMSEVATLRAGVTQTSVQLQQAIAKLAEVIMMTSGAYTESLVDTTA